MNNSHIFLCKNCSEEFIVFLMKDKIDEKKYTWLGGGNPKSYAIEECKLCGKIKLVTAWLDKPLDQEKIKLVKEKLFPPDLLRIQSEDIKL